MTCVTIGKNTHARMYGVVGLHGSQTFYKILICVNDLLFILFYETLFSAQEIYRSSGKFELLERLLPKLKQSNHRV